MLKERQKTILDAVVQEYIKTARPVASRGLIREFDLDMSPATIRNEMLQLDDFGYLEQPHTSAGRIPTDKGYRFFVDHLLQDFSLSVAEERLINRVFKMKEEDIFVREFSRVLSHVSETFAAVGILGENIFYESGFSEILEEPEFHDPECVKSFGRFVDFLDDEVKSMLPQIKNNQLFIGRENPLKDALDYSMALSTWVHPRGFRGYFTLVGPKRTNYHRHKAIIKSVTNHER